jgi:hypothetical protein
MRYLSHHCTDNRKTFTHQDTIGFVFLERYKLYLFIYCNEMLFNGSFKQFGWVFGCS